MRTRTNVSIMREVYAEIKLDGFESPERAYHWDAAVLRSLHRIQQNCPLYWEQHRQYERRMALHRALRDSAIDGKCVVIESGMDCDCVQYTGRKHTIDANIKAFNQLEDSIAEYADGPFTLWPVSPTQAAEIHYASRDRALEAYENGHPESIVCPGSVHEDAPY